MMNPLAVSAAIFICIFGAVLLGMRLHRVLPEHHLSADSKDVVKLSTGLVATVTALLLAFLLASAKGSFDTCRTDVIQMVAKTALLDRLLTGYGPEAHGARQQLRGAIVDSFHSMWQDGTGTPASTAPNFQVSTAVYAAVQCLVPHNDMQTGAKTQALALMMQIAELRWLLHAQLASSISMPMLIIIVCWLVAIFLSFSLLAPANTTIALALKISALSVSGAIYLILELDQPFSGLIRLSNEPMLQLLHLLVK